MSHLILVRYNRKLIATFPDAIINSFDSVETVWTDYSPGQFINNPNECFEFSGYQEGLARVLHSIKNDNIYQNKNYHTIIFANDTIFSGHTNFLVIYILNRFLLLKRNQIFSGPKLTGLVMSNSTINFSIAPPSGYVSTWLFMLEGTHEQLSTIKFYDPLLVMSNFITDKYHDLPLLYKQSVDDWLQPSHFLRGWYQAVPGRDLPTSVLERKRFSIYLEHSLPNRVMTAGFDVFDLSQRVDFFNRILLKFFRFIDRCYVNLIKLRLRFFY